MVRTRRDAILVTLLAGAALPGGLRASSLQEQIDAALPGATLSIPADLHSGPITISKPLTIQGDPGAVIDGGGEGKVVSITAPDVELRGFTITGSGRDFLRDDAGIHISADRVRILDNRIEDSLHGIYLRKVVECVVSGNTILGRAPPESDLATPSKSLGDAGAEACSTDLANSAGSGNGIHLWNSARCRISGNTISGARDGLYFSFTEGCTVSANAISHVRYGLHYMYSDRNTFADNVFRDSAAGAAVMFSKGLTILGNRFLGNRGSRGCGILLQSVDASRIEGNEIAGNTLALSFNQCYGNRVIGNTIRANFTGIRFSANSEQNEFSMNRILRNLNPVEVHGDTRSNAFSSAGIGNYWEGAPIVDFNGDGVGELPHRELDLTGELRSDFPPAILLTDSPLMRLLRFAHQRAALPGAHSIQDDAPLAAHRATLGAARIDTATGESL